MMDCDRCGQPFFDYEGYEEKQEGIVCSYCMDEELVQEEESSEESA
jgi:uncharacterized Zn finger protein (UPF0148 family)